MKDLFTDKWFTNASCPNVKKKGNNYSAFKNSTK